MMCVLASGEPLSALTWTELVVLQVEGLHLQVSDGLCYTKSEVPLLHCVIGNLLRADAQEGRVGGRQT